MRDLRGLLAILLMAAAVSSASAGKIVKYVGESCQTPNNTAGTCKGLTDCSVILALVSLPVDQRPVQYLRGCMCNSYIIRTPVVCCPDEVPTTTTTTTDHPPTDKPNSHEINREGCGLSYVGRIIGGTVADLSEFPWMAVLNYRRGSIVRDECGGSLITDTFVLTAAHCINNKLKQIRLGEHDVRTDPDCEPSFKGETCAHRVQTFTIKRTLKHPQYSDKTYVNDIALIELDRPANLTDYVNTICLPDEGRNVEGTNVTVAGWGITEKNTTSPVLMKAHVPLMSLTNCQAAFLSKGARLVLSDDQICAGGSGLTDSCSGDSGGPMKQLDGYSKYVQYGIVSYGTKRCATPGLPAVYTAVSKYISWINQTITYAITPRQ